MQILVTRKPVCTSACPFVRGPFADGEYRCSICPSHVCKSPIVCPYLKEYEASEEHTRITPNEYQKHALTTQNPCVLEDLRVVEGVMGLAGEADGFVAQHPLFTEMTRDIFCPPLHTNNSYLKSSFDFTNCLSPHISHSYV